MSEVSGLKHGRETSYPNWIFRHLPPSLQANAETGFISSLTFPSQQFASHYSKITLPPTLFTKSLNQNKTNKTMYRLDTTVSAVPVLRTAVDIWCELLRMCWLSVRWQCLYCLLRYVTTKVYIKKKLRTNFVYTNTGGDFFNQTLDISNTWPLHKSYRSISGRFL